MLKRDRFVQGFFSVLNLPFQEHVGVEARVPALQGRVGPEQEGRRLGLRQRLMTRHWGNNS